MILALLVAAIIFGAGMLAGRKSMSVSLSAELTKIETLLSADEQAALAKIKSLLKL